MIAYTHVNHLNMSSIFVDTNASKIANMLENTYEWSRVVVMVKIIQLTDYLSHGVSSHLIQKLTHLRA